MIIKITDKKERTKNEAVLDQQFRIVSRSGIHITEKVLIEKLPENKNPKRILILENRTGVIAMIARCLFPEAEIETLNIDVFYQHKIQRNLKMNQFDSIQTRCQSEIERDNYDLILFQVAGQIHKELVMDFIEQIALKLRKNGKLMIGAGASIKWLHKHLMGKFSGLTLFKEKTHFLFIIKKKQVFETRHSFKAEFTMNFQDLEIPMSSLPGTFAHHRIDDGALALLDIVAFHPQNHILDMGCGIGSIGIAMAKKEPTISVDFLDSNARALHSTRENCAQNNIENTRYILSETGSQENDKYDVYVGNPPYFSDYRIAEIFIDTAKKTLKKDGKAYIVAKNITDLQTIFGTHFPKMEIMKSRGYNILIGTK